MPSASGGGLSTSRSCKVKKLQYTHDVFWIIFSLLILMTHFVEFVAPLQWLSVKDWQDRHWNRTSDCRRRQTPGFVKLHRKICDNQPELMPSIVDAAHQTSMVCQDLFQDKRWNCSSITHAPKLLPDLTGGSREQAFVYALSSAALMQSIGRACTRGITTQCGCGPMPNELPPGEFTWGGCGDDIGFSAIFSSLFADAPFKKRENSKVATVNMHNNKVGRIIAERLLKIKCKCHGVSGSCATKTCWKELPNLQIIGETIRERYALAREVKTRRSRDKNKETRVLRPIRGRKKIAPDDLVYFTMSPDYCLPDPTSGSLGTFGRECKKDERGSSGCQLMCCGRGYTSQIVTVSYRCDCKYYWCCYVKCKTCTKKVEINRCR